MDAALVTAWCTGTAAVIAAVGAVLKIVFTRPRIPVAEEVLERLAQLEDYLLAYGTWAHQVRMIAVTAGMTLPVPPHDPAEHRNPHRLPPHLMDKGPETNPLPAQR
jgi:hypothetical protein